MLAAAVLYAYAVLFPGAGGETPNPFSGQFQHAASIYNPKSSAPLSVLIDKHGSVVRVREGYNPGDEALVAADVARLVAAEPAVQAEHAP